MVKEKGKRRLDKVAGSTTDFIGFGAFANQSLGSEIFHSKVDQLYSWTPVYVGKDERFASLFARIRQKRDSITVSRLLRELHELIEDAKIQKPVLADVLRHWVWLFYNKLHFDNNPTIRALAIQTWIVALHRVPKIVHNIVAVQPEVLGMLYTVNVDPSSEVRALSSSALFCPVSREKDTSATRIIFFWPWQQGIIDYVNHMLSYNRASAMNDDLFTKRKDASAEVSEREKELMEERFERIISTSLCVVEHWIRVGCEAIAKQIDEGKTSMFAPLMSMDSEQSMKWFRSLSSNKPAIRRNAYLLLRTVAAKTPHLLPAEDSLINRLVQVVSSETESTNFPTLFESILSTLNQAKSKDRAHFPHSPAYSWTMLVKPLAKVLSKACFGASVDLWGPMVLPLMVLLCDFAIIETEDSICNSSATIMLLKAVFDSRKCMLNDTDQYNLLTAVTECASFELLRKRDAGTIFSRDDSLILVQIWLEAFKQGLSLPLNTRENTASNLFTVAKTTFLIQLSEQMLNFQGATKSHRECLFLSTSEWFWSDGLGFSCTESDSLAQLLHHLRIRSEFPHGDDLHQRHTKESILFFNPLQQHLHHLLRHCQLSSSSMPTESTYRLFIASFEYCGPLLILESYSNESPECTLERFVMNGLLRWMIVHTSRISEGSKTECFVELDFQILLCCLESVPHKRNSLWESLLREVVAANCSIELLTVGIRYIVQVVGQGGVAWIKCNALDDLALKIHIQSTFNDSLLPQVCLSPLKNSEVQSASLSSYGIALDFCKLCLGLNSKNPSLNVLVSNEVIDRWIQMTSNPTRSCSSDPVLEALLLLIRSEDNFMSKNQVDSILLATWNNKSDLHESYSLPFLRDIVSSRNRFLESASQRLQADFEEYVNNFADQYLSNASWSKRAWRVLDVCLQCGEKHISLDLIGLSDPNVWNSNPEILYQHLTLLFEHMESHSDRLILITTLRSGERSIEVLVEILLSLSEASPDILYSSSARVRRDRCSSFLHALGNDALDKVLIESMVRSIILNLDKKLALKINRIENAEICRYTCVLSQLLELACTPEPPPLRLADIVEGRKMRYIKNPERPEEAELVRIMKVHRDDPTGYYFTIESGSAGNVLERQTVLDRLQREQEASALTESLNLTMIRNLISEKILKHLVSEDSSVWSLGEIIHIVIKQIGFGRDRGIGSLHYEVYRLLSGVENKIRLTLASDAGVEAWNSLWLLSVALGFGLNCPSSSSVLQQIRFDPSKLCEDLVAFLESGLQGRNESDLCAILVWLITAIPLIFNKETVANDMLLEGLVWLFRLSCHILASENTRTFSSATLLACRGIHLGIVSLMDLAQKGLYADEPMASALLKAQKDSLFYLIRSFSIGWQCAGKGIDRSCRPPDWKEFSAFPDLIELSTQSGNLRKIIAEASAQLNIDALTSCLHDEWKRWYAFMLLDAVARSGLPLQNSKEDLESAMEISNRLECLINGFEENDVDGALTEFHIVSQWVPLKMMQEIESWNEGDLPDTGDVAAVGRLLTWIIFLRFVDTATPKDFTIRPAFVSYLGKCGAISSILNLAVLNDEAIHQRKREAAPATLEIGDTINESSVNISKLASMTLFRTVEVFPSLSRRWWEEDCPRLYSNIVQVFVEKYVAPEILKRELERIKTSTVFGQMNVSASLVSREVTASYIQDDFTLNVVISLPSAFPFRSAEVDCSKTLGVPQSRWKRWSLQITLMLNNQGGTLQDALMLWKDNVDKEFEGVEPCPVCYSVLHVKTHKLPTLACKTCHKRFHVDCLTQWFKSSGKNLCVLCQQPWAGTRIQ